MRVLAALAALFAASSSAFADGDWDPAGGPGINSSSNIGLTALRAFNTFLYIGTENPSLGARIYRTNDGVAFTTVATGGFGDGVTKITEFEEFSGVLYCGTASPAGGSVYRSSDGLVWTLVSPVGLGSATNAEVTALAIYSGAIYAATRKTGGGGAELWKSTDGTTWTTSITTTGFGDADNTAINDLEVSSSFLYAATTNTVDGGNYVQITSGGTFTILVNDGFSSSANTAFTALELYRGEMYIGTRNSSNGYEVWATPDNFGFFRRLKDGGSDPQNVLVTDLERFGDFLYVGVESVGEPFEVLRTFDGFNYDQEDADGFDNPANFRANDFADYANNIWCGTSNPAGGDLYETELPSSGSFSASSDDDDSHSWRSRCFVATAAYGSPAVPRVAELRRIRDQRVEACVAGRRFTDLYRASAPPVAEVVHGSEVLRALLRRTLLK
ncbi:MAG: CFI-box-CTERM domain-containing protein [Planctomycetota bacterium]